MTLGTIAKLKTVTQGILDIPVFHRIPNKMMEERWEIERAEIILLRR